MQAGVQLISSEHETPSSGEPAQQYAVVDASLPQLVDAALGRETDPPCSLEPNAVSFHLRWLLKCIKRKETLKLLVLCCLLALTQGRGRSSANFEEFVPPISRSSLCFYKFLCSTLPLFNYFFPMVGIGTAPGTTHSH
ncbi:hypothetical protein TSMEX_005950 [Taenia solium]|eukprot:TsM_000325000 transcript=TsM_000325000 gene=TsM_000325000